jgi:hypothetical protein
MLNMGADIMVEAEVIVSNGRIWTGQPYPLPGGKVTPAIFAEAVAIANGRFLAVGSNQQIKVYTGRNTKIIDLQGRMAMPGFIDSHVRCI